MGAWPWPHWVHKGAARGVEVRQEGGDLEVDPKVSHAVLTEDVKSYKGEKTSGEIVMTSVLALGVGAALQRVLRHVQHEGPLLSVNRAYRRSDTGLPGEGDTSCKWLVAHTWREVGSLLR